MGAKFCLQELIDIPKLQALLDSLYTSSGIPSGIIDLEGNVLAGGGWQDICTKFHRGHPDSLKDCIHSDITIAAGVSSSAEHAQVTCPRGLTDTATPLIIEGQHLANVFTGQLFIKEPDQAFFQQQARQFGFDESAYLEAFKKVPVITQKQLDEYLTFIAQFTAQLAIQGLAHLRTMKTKEDLREALKFNNQVIQSVQEGVIVNGLDLRYQVWNPFMEKLSGLSADEVLGKHPLEVFPFLQVAGVIERLNRALAGDMVENIEFPYHVSKTGREGWCIDNSAPFRNADGEIIGVLATVTDITERKQAEEAQQSQQAMLSRTEAIAHVGSWVLDLVTNSLTWSDEVYRIFGETPQTYPATYETFLQTVHPEDREALKQTQEDSMHQGKETWEIEHRIIRRDTAEIRFVHEKCIHLRDESGVVIKSIGMVQDITERKQAELEVDRSHSLLANLASLVPGVLYQYRLFPDGRSAFPYSSPGMNEIYEVTPEEVRIDATPVFGRLHPEDFDSVAEAIKNSALTLEEFYSEFRVILPRQGLRWRWSQAHPQRMEDGGTLWHGIILDITERKMAEFALQEGLASFKAMFDVSPIPFVLNNTDGKISFLNPAFTSSFGYTAQDLPDLESWWRQAYPDPAYRDWVVSAWGERLASAEQEGSDFEPLEVKIRCRDGSERSVIASSVELRGVQGATNLVALYDITERKQAEEERAKLQSQLMQSQKMDSLGSLAGGVAHDINNVLAAIQALSSLHKKLAPSDTRIQRDMETIAKACQRGGKLTRGLLTFARQELGEEQSIDLNAVVREEVDLLARTTLQKVKLEMDLGEDLLQVKGDPGALSHALMNLCVNAVDAMTEGGTLTLRTRNGASGMVLLEVADTGSGMPKEILSKAMDPFFTTKPQGKGTGLGLSIVYGTVKAHQGRMEIQSEPNKGTRVMMHFPAIGYSENTGPTEEQKSDPSKGALHVLLVDDDELIQSSVPMILELLGHAVTAVLGGEEALALLENGLRPDVVILDMNMPGLDGPGTLPRLRSLCPTVPVLLSTGREDQVARDLTVDYPFVALLSKPFTIEELEQSLETIAGG